jgi:hypothetical protein
VILALAWYWETMIVMAVSTVAVGVVGGVVGLVVLIDERRNR